jgi:uncharacterized SAM-binding protein YcdF (DUF218 family)
MIEKGPSLVNDRRLFRVPIQVVVLIAAGGLAAAWCGWCFDRSFVEKLATQLALPCGLIWLTLIGMTYRGFLSDRRWGTALLLLLLFYWVAGSGYTSQRILSLLEDRYACVDPPTAEAFDVLIVLGGGTVSNPAGDVWLSPRGDRLVLAARLYHQGKAKRLVSTGQAFDWMTDQALGPAASAARVWKELGIPAESIVQIGGRNTAEEMQQIRQMLAQQPRARLGLLTSAFHLPRALRLAQAQGLDVHPVPADFRTQLLVPWPLLIVTTSEGFMNTEMCVREYLAYLVRR